jgi:hypothetical protein
MSDSHNTQDHHGHDDHDKTVSTDKPHRSETKTVGKPLIIGAAAILFILSLAFFTWPRHKSSADRKEPESTVVKKEEVALPDSFTKEIALKKGSPVEITVPLHYDYECSGGGKTYFIKAQNQKWGLVGGGIPYIRQNESSAFFYLKPDKEEITVVVSFKKKLRQ